MLLREHFQLVKCIGAILKFPSFQGMNGATPVIKKLHPVCSWVCDSDNESYKLLGGSPSITASQWRHYDGYCLKPKYF